MIHSIHYVDSMYASTIEPSHICSARSVVDLDLKFDGSQTAYFGVLIPYFKCEKGKGLRSMPHLAQP